MRKLQTTVAQYRRFLLLVGMLALIPLAVSAQAPASANTFVSSAMPNINHGPDILLAVVRAPAPTFSSTSPAFPPTQPSARPPYGYTWTRWPRRAASTCTR
jgi:hypothetical protein